MATEALSAAAETKGKADKTLANIDLAVACHELRTPVIAEQEHVRALMDGCVDLESLLKGMDETSIDPILKGELLRSLELRKTTLCTIGICVNYQYGSIMDVLGLSKAQASQLEFPKPSNEVSPTLVYSFPRRKINKILVADDFIVNRKMVMQALNKAGYQCIGVEDGLKAVEMCAVDEFLAVIIDLIMPIMGGIEATKEIRRQEKEKGKTPEKEKGKTRVMIFACTAKPLSPEEQKELTECGMNGFLDKRFDVQQMHALMAKCEGNSILAEPESATSLQERENEKEKEKSKAKMGGSKGSIG